MAVKVKVGKAKVGKGRRGLGGANWGLVGDILNATVGNMARLGRLIEDTNPENKKKNKEMDEKMKKKGQYNLTGGRRAAPKKVKPDPKKIKPIKNKKK